MKTPASVAARVRVAVVCAVVLAVFAGAFMLRVHDAVTEKSAVFDLGVLLVIGALLFGGAIAIVASGIAIAPLDAMTSTARAMRRDLGLRTRVTGTDELGQLGEALDGLAAWVGSEKQGLEDDRNRLMAILESMTEGVLVTSGDGAHDGVIVLANAALRDMFLLDRGIVGRPPVEAIRVAGLDEILSRAGDGEIELGGLRPRRVLVRVAPIKADRPGLVAVFNDVTELRRLESVRRDFVANVSHELRTPIHAISSSAETLQSGALDDRATAAEFVDIIRRHATRLQLLVEDLLELSRIEAREWKLELATCDGGEVIDAAIEAVAVAASQREATISRKTAAIAIRADRRALEHVLANLLDNAVKYGGSRIEVAVERVGDRAVFRVCDHGQGIAPRHLPRIFERFYRVDPGRSRAVGGTGLGLSIVKNLVEAMHGSVEVTSEVGRGTIFTVALPVAVTESKVD